MISLRVLRLAAVQNTFGVPQLLQRKLTLLLTTHETDKGYPNRT